MLTTRRRNNVSLKKGIVLYTIPGNDKEYKGMILVCHPYEVIITSRESQMPTLLIRNKTLEVDWNILLVDDKDSDSDWFPLDEKIIINRITFRNAMVKRLLEKDERFYLKEIIRIQKLFDI